MAAAVDMAVASFETVTETVIHETGIAIENFVILAMDPHSAATWIEIGIEEIVILSRVITAWPLGEVVRDLPLVTSVI